MDELFLILKEKNRPYKIAQHLQPHKLLRQLVSNTHPQAHPETRVSKGFRDSYPDSLSVSRCKQRMCPKDFQMAQKGQETW